MFVELKLPGFVVSMLKGTWFGSHILFRTYFCEPFACLCIVVNVTTTPEWLFLSSSSRYIFHRSPRFGEAQTGPSQGTGTWAFSENIMNTLLYRGQPYTTHESPSAKSCVELTYRHEHYNTCREQLRNEMHRHSTLMYRGIPYSR